MKLLAVFREKPEYLDFCIPELKSLIYPYNKSVFDLFEHDVKGKEEIFKEKTYNLNMKFFKDFPYIYVKLDNEDITKKIINNAILTRAFIKVFGEGLNYEMLFEDLKTNFHSFKPFMES